MINNIETAADLANWINFGKVDKTIALKYFKDDILYACAYTDLVNYYISEQDVEVTKEMVEKYVKDNNIDIEATLLFEEFGIEYTEQINHLHYKIYRYVTTHYDECDRAIQNKTIRQLLQDNIDIDNIKSDNLLEKYFKCLLKELDLLL